MKISTILDKIDENQLYVPAFQREYVWKREDAKKLLDSLIKEYPTGTMLTWETSSPPELKGKHVYNEKQGAVRILLDGQQRITTLYMLIKGDIPPYYTEPEITVNTRGLYVNVETLELEYHSPAKMKKEPRWQNITDIFQKKIRAKDIVRQMEENGESVTREFDDLIDDNMLKIQSIVDREFPEQTIPVRANIREAIDIFYKVNASGVSLTEAELALAQISGYWPQARDIFKAKLVELEKVGFVLRLDFLVFVLLGCMYHLGSDMTKLHAPENNDRIRDVWKRLESQVLDYVVNIMRSHAYVDHTDEINSPFALIPMIVFCFDKQNKHPSDSEIRKMVKWFYYSQIRGRYVSQLHARLDQDLRIVNESTSPFDELLGVISEDRRLEISPDEFIGRDVRHPLFGLMKWYFKSVDAVCFTTGLTLRRNMGKKYQLERDHIFPFSLLKDRGYGKDNRIKYSLAQELTNRAILTQIANRTKSAEDPYNYLMSVKGAYPRAMPLQCIPPDESLWQLDKYEEFLVARRKILADELNAFLENITETEVTSLPLTTEELIAEGENDVLEFKAQLRWDHKQGVLNKKLEEVILKSVAAFANKQGGTLLIGVRDDGSIVGLEHEYSTLENGDKDKFELHLNNLLRQAFGVTFVTSRIKVKFPTVNGVEICQVDVSPASQLITLKMTDKNGQLVEKVFVRSGNASQELPLSEVQAYIKERF